MWSAAPGDPTTATIAMYKRERDAAAGTIIAVSANYTAYGIRGGLIRVIHRHSDAMGLLRGHSHNPQDLAFLAGTDVLASVAGDGNLFVWKLQRADSGEISPEEVFHATWEAKASGPPERLAFKPAAEPGLLVTVSHHGDDAAKLKLWDLRGSPALGPQDLDTGGSDTTCAVAFSGDGAKLATGDGRGGVAVGTLATAAAWAPSRFAAADGAAVSAVAFSAAAPRARCSSPPSAKAPSFGCGGSRRPRHACRRSRSPTAARPPRCRSSCSSTRRRRRCSS